MRRSNVVIALLIAGAALLSAFLPGATPPASALPGFATTCTYYSDSTHTHQVGTCLFGCTSVRCSGTETNFFVCRNQGSC